METQTQAGVVANPLGTKPIGGLVVKYSVPVIISLLVNAVYNIVDQIFIGQGIGILGMAATNVAFPLTTISTAIALLLGVGGAANFNLCLGAGNKSKAGYFAGNAISLLAILGTVVGVVVLLFLQPLLVLFGATANVMPYAMPYTVIIAIGIPFTVFSTGASNLIRADGAPNYAMICMLAGAVFNLIFDPVFLFVFDMGIEGIALATTLGQVLSSVLALLYFVRRFQSVPLKKEYFRPRWTYAKVVFSLGVASCLNQLSMTVVQIALNNTMRHYGAQTHYGSDIPIAAVGAISKVMILLMAFTIGLAQGCQPINSFNYGARQYGRVKQTLKTSLAIAMAISVLSFLAYQLFPRQLIGIFGEGTPEYFEFAISYMRIYMFMTFLNGIQPITANFLTSIGKAKVGVFISLTRQILFLLPLILIFPMVWGLNGVLYAGPIADLASAVVSAVLIVRELRIMTAQEKEMQAQQTEERAEAVCL